MSHVRFVHTEIESLGIEYLSASLKRASHTTDIVFDLLPVFDVRLKNRSSRLRDAFLRILLKNKPDVLAFSISSINIEWAFFVAESVKTLSNVPIVFGGVHATLIPDTIMSKGFIDYLIVGEGDGAIVELVDGLSRGKVDPECKNLWLRKDWQLVKNLPRALISSLDSLPFPDKEINPLLILQSGRYSIITGRGCVGACTYCCVPMVRKELYPAQKIMRRRSPENVIAELVQAKKRFPLKKVFFEDDLFTDDKKWLAQFASFYQRDVALPCKLCAHPNFVDEEVVSFLQMIQCHAVQIGVQSLNARIREEVLKRFYSNEQVEKCFGLLKSAGISVTADNIISLPRERPEDVLEMVRFYNEIRPGKVDVFYLKYYPKSEIMKFINRPQQELDDFNGGRLYKSVTRSDHSQRTVNEIHANKLLLVLALTYFLPRGWVRFILDRGWYVYLPSLSICYTINQLFFYVSCLFFRDRRPALTSFRGADVFKAVFAIKQWFVVRFGTYCYDKCDRRN